MKLFVNDWNGDRDSFVINTEENREYKIDTWIGAADSRRIYLASAYVYDEFVMFFYIYERNHETVGEPFRYIPQTRRDLIMRSEKSNNHIAFDYEINHLKAGRWSSGECLPRHRPDNVPDEERDEFFEMYFGEYDYLAELMKDRLPEELRGVDIAFRKDCYSFSEHVTEIEHIAIYPPRNEVKRYFIDKTFTVPFGECDIKTPYLTGGEESYIVLRELKILDMLKLFEERYDEFKKAEENSLRQLGDSKGQGNQGIIDLDEMRCQWDKRLLTVSYLVPEEKRSFAFYTAEYLNSKIPDAVNGAHAGAFIFLPDKDDRMAEGLYKGVSVLGEICEPPKDEYEITLMWASEAVEYGRNAVFEMEFNDVRKIN